MGSKVLAGRYEIFEKIGEGGMAVVYKARDKLLNRFVAIKILRPEYLKDSALVDSFRRESQAAASLSHPNIVNVYDVGKEGNIYYIVMEIIEGPTLSQVIKSEGPLDYKRTIEIGKQIASALSLAHKNNIIHRDVKPQNILMTQDGVAKITDFGIAKAASDATIVTQPNTVMGSAHYFSPEQARGQYVDEKSDIYSLGIVLYEMLTGRVPFDADNPVTIGIMHMNEELTPPSKLVDGIPPGLEQIVMKATEKYQVNRFKSVEEMFDALDNVNFITGIIDDPKAKDSVRTDRGNAAGMAAAAAAGAMAGATDESLAADEFDEYDNAEAPKDDDEVLDKKGQKAKRKAEKQQKKQEKKERNKGLKKFKVLAVILAILIAIPVSYGLYQGINYFMGEGDVVVPKVVGMTEENARAALEEEGLKMRVGDEVASDEYDAGIVLSQDPPANNKVDEGSFITVSISSGETGEIPNVVGKSREDAEYILNEKGFEVGNVSHEDSNMPSGTVLSQSPDAGEKADAGDKVDLVLSKGSTVEEVSMPDLIGLTESKAKKKLQDIGLVLGKITYENNSNYKKGTVMWQQYSSGTKLGTGKTVKIKVSKGAAEEKPKKVKLTINFDSAPADIFKLTVAQVKSNGKLSYIINNEERHKSQGSEKVTVSGTGTGKVNIYFNDSLVDTYTVNYTEGTYYK